LTLAKLGPQAFRRPLYLLTYLAGHMCGDLVTKRRCGCSDSYDSYIAMGLHGVGRQPENNVSWCSSNLRLDLFIQVRGEA